MDIQQIMQLLQARGGGMAQAPNPLGALQPGMGAGPGMAPPVAQPDFNAILYRQMMQEQQDRMQQMMQQRAAQGTLGAGGLVPNAPAGFGAQPPQAAPPPQMTQPAGEAMLPGGGMSGALGNSGAQPGLMQQRRNVAPY